jgi:hypothetical protein
MKRNIAWLGLSLPAIRIASSDQLNVVAAVAMAIQVAAVRFAGSAFRIYCETMLVTNILWLEFVALPQTGRRAVFSSLVYPR